MDIVEVPGGEEELDGVAAPRLHRDAAGALKAVDLEGEGFAHGAPGDAAREMEADETVVRRDRLRPGDMQTGSRVVIGDLLK